ncbi:MAG: selenium metabolism-associated LysR family transcriptional regulator [Actinomycetota bacterium]
MNISYFKTFLAVVEKKSFSEAAKVLNLSQPAISFQIQAIEKTYGEVLLDRTGPKVRLTEAGEIFQRFAREILRANESLEQSIDELKGGLRGRLKLGASTIPGEYVVPKILGGFKEKFPNVELTLQIEDSEQIVEKLVNAEIDIGFIGAYIPKENFKLTKLATDELILILPANHPLCTKESMSVKEILREPFIVREVGSGTRKSFEKVLEKLDLSLDDFNVVIELGSTQAVLSAVEGGLGISVISRWAAEKALRLGTIKTITLKDIDLHRDLYLVYDQRRLFTRIQKEFVKHILR